MVGTKKMFTQVETLPWKNSLIRPGSMDHTIDSVCQVFRRPVHI